MSEGPDETVEFRQPPPAPFSAQTAPIPLVDGVRARPTSVGLVFTAVAAAALLIGIAVASGTRAKPTGAVVADAMVGPSGATLRFEGGELRIPAGALSSPRHIVVRTSVVRRRVRVTPPDGRTRIFQPRELVAFTFEPDTIQFALPVKIVLRLPDIERNGMAFARAEENTLLLGGKVDGDRGTVTVRVTDFHFDREQRL